MLSNNTEFSWTVQVRSQDAEFWLHLINIPLSPSHDGVSSVQLIGRFNSTMSHGKAAAGPQRTAHEYLNSNHPLALITVYRWFSNIFVSFSHIPASSGYNCTVPSQGWQRLWWYFYPSGNVELPIDTVDGRISCNNVRVWYNSTRATITGNVIASLWKRNRQFRNQINTNKLSCWFQCCV